MFYKNLKVRQNECQNYRTANKKIAKTFLYEKRRIFKHFRLFFLLSALLLSILMNEKNNRELHK